jgi:hypothetical protein
MERCLQLEKQSSAIVSTDEGMQIDVSDEQPENAAAPRSETLQPLSKVTVAIFLHPKKHPEPIRSMAFEILTRLLKPKYRTSDVSSRLIRKSSQTFRTELCPSTQTFAMSECRIHRALSCPNHAGMQIRVSDEQKANTALPNVETRQSHSKVTLERAVHPEKQRLEMISIEEGTQIDRKDEQ